MNVAVPKEVADRGVWRNGDPRLGLSQLLVSLHQYIGSHGLLREREGGSKGVGAEIELHTVELELARGALHRSQKAANVGVERESVKCHPEKFEDGYGEQGSVVGRHGKVPAQPVGEAADSVYRRIPVAGVRRELKADGPRVLELASEKRTLHADSAGLEQQSAPTLKHLAHQRVASD